VDRSEGFSLNGSMLSILRVDGTARRLENPGVESSMFSVLGGLKQTFLHGIAKGSDPVFAREQGTVQKLPRYRAHTSCESYE